MDDEATYTNQREDHSIASKLIHGFVEPLFQPDLMVRCAFMFCYLYLFSFVFAMIIPAYGDYIFYALVCGFIVFMYYNYEHWRWRRVPGPTPILPWGTEKGLPFFIGMLEFNKWLYHEKGGKNYCGYIHIRKPTLFVGNPDLIQCITRRDSRHFLDRNPLLLSEELAKSLYALRGGTWQKMRARTDFGFSKEHWEHFHNICLNNAMELRQFMLEKTETKGEVELMDAFGRYTMKNAASFAFGVDCDCVSDRSSEFVSNVTKLFAKPRGLAMLRQVLLMVYADTGIDVWLRKKVLWDPYAPLICYFTEVVRKERIRRDNSTERHYDFLQVLLDAKDGSGNRALSDEIITAQCIQFFTIGYETTAAMLTFCTFCLTRDTKWQLMVRSGCMRILNRYMTNPTQCCMFEVPILDSVLSEALRLYPPTISMERTCNKPYNLPGTNVKIRKGMKVQIPIYQLHHDPDLFTDPEKFDPYRFLPTTRKPRHSCAFMPFGNGPRSCMGKRFALHQARLALFVLASKCEFLPGPRTPEGSMPLDEKALFLTPKKGCGFIKVVPLVVGESQVEQQHFNMRQ